MRLSTNPALCQSQGAATHTVFSFPSSLAQRAEGTPSHTRLLFVERLIMSLVTFLHMSYRERAEAAAAKRDMRPSVLQASSGAVSQGSLAGPLSLVAHPSSLSLAAGIDDLVTALKPRRSSGGAIREDSSLLSVSGVAFSLLPWSL